MSISSPTPGGATGRGSPAEPLTLGGPPHFAILGVPVRVGLGFWMMSVFFGLAGRSAAESPAVVARRAAVWTIIVFVSVLVHEMGHALVVRRFGGRPGITLYAMGGLTNYRLPNPLSRPKRVVVSLAGPFAGFTLAALVWLATHQLRVGAAQSEIIGTIMFVNVWWGIVNLVPVIPFDGGHVLAAALGPRRAYATALISAAVGIAVALFGFLHYGSIWIAFLFGSASVSAIAQARAAKSSGLDAGEGLDEQLAKAKAALARGELDDAYTLADDVVRRARTLPVRNGGYTALAWVHLARGDGKTAREDLKHVDPPSAVDPYTWAAVEDAAGDPRRARDVLEQARAQGAWSREMSKLLIDLYARDGNLERSAERAIDDASMLEADDLRAVVRAAIEGGAHRKAATLAAKLFEMHGTPTDAIDEARALALAGDVGGALAALAHAVTTGASTEGLAEDPAFATIAGDERFRSLVTSRQG